MSRSLPFVSILADYLPSESPFDIPRPQKRQKQCDDDKEIRSLEEKGDPLDKAQRIEADITLSELDGTQPGWIGKSAGTVFGPWSSALPC